MSSFTPTERKEEVRDVVVPVLQDEEEDAREQQEQARQEQHCLVCFDSLRYPTILPCGHNHICGPCHLRLRYLHGDNKCPICKTTHDIVICDEMYDATTNSTTEREQRQNNVSTRSFEEYPLWGTELGPSFYYQQDVGMFFPLVYYQKEIVPLLGYQCLACNDYDGTTPDENTYDEQDDDAARKSHRGKNKRTKPVTPLRALQDHLRTKHRLALCQLCVDHKRDFVSQLPRYTPSELQRHLQGTTSSSNRNKKKKSKSTTDDGSRGHPMCEFCRPKRFYDLVELHAHLQREHYKCHVCDRLGKPNQYFRNYEALERHFDTQHYLCAHPVCREARFVVFDNELDLRGHELATHGTTSNGGSTKIQLEFRYRRPNESSQQQQNQHRRQDVPSSQDFEYGLNGEAFVPEDLPQVEGNNVNTDGAPHQDYSHPLHLQRTNELRAHAAQIRRQRNMEEAPEAFPTLQEPSSSTSEGTAMSSTPLRIGWTSSEGGASVASRLGRSNRISSNAENFPALPSVSSSTTSNNKKKTSVLVKLTKGSSSGGAGRGMSSNNRQYAAIKGAADVASTAANGSGWATTGGGGARAAAATTTTTTSASSFPSLISTTSLRPSTVAAQAPTAAASARSNNRQSDLTIDNFPSLGGSTASTTTTTKYSAADNLARKSRAAAAAPPSFKSTADFPPPPVASTTSSSSGAASVAAKKPPPPAVDNVLDFPPPPPPSSSSNAQGGATSIDDIKATLGSAKYKQLRKLTKEFAADAIAPDAYVDHAASLFERGYADSDFWSFLPTLLASCPNTSSATKAQRYMEDLRRVTATSSSSAVTHATSTGGSKSGWTSKPNITAASRTPSGPSTSASSWSAMSTNSTAAARARPVAPTKRPPGKATTVWSDSGSSSLSTVSRVKQRPGSITADAAAVEQAESQKGSTATKFMAKEAKASKKHETKKAKKKQNEELRALAFGGK